MSFEDARFGLDLSAPLAISIGRIRGFLHYLTIGIIASIIGMIFTAVTAPVLTSMLKRVLKTVA